MLGWNRIATGETDENGEAREDAMSTVNYAKELCEGIVQLEIRSFESFRQINRYTKYLSTIENLRIISESWWEEEGFKIVLSVQAPMVLRYLLQDMPEVKRVYYNGNKSGFGGYKKGCQKIVVELNTTEAALEPVLV